VFGAGGGTSSYREVEETDVLFLWGANARENHPIFFHHVLKGVHRGARLFAVDPRRTPSAEWADAWLGLNVGSDIALANAMARELITDASGKVTAVSYIDKTDGSEKQVRCRTVVLAASGGQQGAGFRELAHLVDERFRHAVLEPGLGHVLDSKREKPPRIFPRR